MYNFAQALSSGYVKLIDWKSIENANMATVEFKQQLIDTAVELGTVKTAADGMYETLEGHSFNATRSFNDVLQDQWMTSEVLITTLRKYADETTDIGKKASQAATEVTKFTQIFDILKETAQSGWAETWELILGDVDKAKALFTPITTFLSGLIDGISDWRNTLVKGVMESGAGKTLKAISEKINSVSKATEKVTKVTKDYGKVVNEILAGKWGSGQDRWNKLAEAGYDWAHAQNLVNEKLGSGKRHATEYSEAQEKVAETHGVTIEQLEKMSDAQLKQLGLEEEEIKSLREVQKVADETGLSLQEIFDNPDQLSGRNLLINSFKNIVGVLKDAASAVKQAWEEVFNPKGLSADEKMEKTTFLSEMTVGEAYRYASDKTDLAIEAIEKYANNGILTALARYLLNRKN
jgi:hypothetical protein